MHSSPSRRRLLRWSCVFPFVLLAACASPTTDVSAPSPAAGATPLAASPAPPTSGPTATAVPVSTAVPEPTRTPAAPVVSPTAGGTLRWLLVDEPTHLNPAISTTAASPTAWSLALFRGLTRLDPSRLYEPLPDLTTSWQTSSDGLVYTFTLRDGVTWHDGVPFTAADVKFTLDLIRDPKNGARAATDFNRVDGIDVVGPTMLRVRLTQPLPSLPAKLAVSVVPKHYLEGQDPRTSPAARRPVGTGPFKFAEWRLGNPDSLILDASPNFPGGRPALDRIELRFGKDPAALLQRLLNGEADGVTLPPKPARQAAGNSAVELLVFKTASVHALGYNARKPLFADPKVRQAIQRGIDRSGIAQSVYAGLAAPASGPLFGTPFDAPQVNQWNDDPKAVDALMSGLGWKRNSAGIWEKAGTPFTFGLLAGGLAEEAQAVAESLKRAGFGVNLQSGETGSGEADTWLESFGSPVDPDSVYSAFSSLATADKGGLNVGGYADPQVDAALEKGRSVADAAARRAAYLEFQTRLAANPACAYTVSPRATAIVSKKLRGIPREIGALDEGFFFWNVEKWAIS